MMEQRYECKLFKTRDELASFMNDPDPPWLAREGAFRHPAWR